VERVHASTFRAGRFVLGYWGGLFWKNWELRGIRSQQLKSELSVFCGNLKLDSPDRIRIKPIETHMVLVDYKCGNFIRFQ
jgi:hypothetical protein